MAHTVPDGDALKEAFKEALAETLHKQRGLLREDFVEELEDFAFAEAIREGQQTGRIERGAIFELLEDQA
jgi:predicted DNA-binding protein